MNDSKLQMIRALLAKAEATTYPAERDAFNAKANELISKYGIEKALLNANKVVRDTVSVREMWVEAPYAKDKATMVNNVYEALGCKAIQVTRVTPDKRIKLKVYGYDSDLDRAEILYTSLLIQALRGMATVPSAGHQRTTAANRRTWMLGFTGEVSRRIREAEARAAATVEPTPGVSTALVLRDRSAAVQDAFTTDHPRTRQVKSSYSGNGYSAGKAAGARADIGQGRIGTQRMALR
jgi:hypothetical protein